MCGSAEKYFINTSTSFLSHISQSLPRETCIGLKKDSSRRSFWSIRFNETGRRRMFIENICFFIKLIVKPPSFPLPNWIGGNSQWYRTLRRTKLMKFLKWNHFAIGFLHFKRWKAFANKFLSDSVEKAAERHTYRISEEKFPKNLGTCGERSFKWILIGRRFAISWTQRSSFGLSVSRLKHVHLM